MKKAFTIFSIIICNFIFSQNEPDSWKPVNEKDILNKGERVIIPKKYKTFELENGYLKKKLFAAPNENEAGMEQPGLVIALPMPDGSLKKFRVVESPVMAPELAAQFPGIKTFSIKGVDDVYASGKLDWTEFGFHGMIRSPKGEVYIDPYCRNNQTDYITYYTSDFVKDPSQIIPEAESENVENTDQKKSTNDLLKSVQSVCVANNLRTYRLAVACTGEYAKAATGLTSPTVAQTLSCIVTSINRVDGVYETEVDVKMVLVATETNVIFTDPASDPFAGNNSPGTLINESQTVIDNNIGNANYDIGHTFSTGGGGLAFLGCVCNSATKAKGITGSPSPVGDSYDIDYVVHEIGHEFGANHTFTANTGACSGQTNSTTRVEPGSGVTIMAYAGICNTTNDLAAHSIAYMHAISYDEIIAYTTAGNGNSCAVTTSSGNNSPTVTSVASYSIPVSTPFSLTASATDPDGDSITYQWEEVDVAGATGNWNSGNKPYFRSYIPDTNPTRLFPKLSVILSGNMTGTIGEYLPSSAQTLKFRCSVRDNKMGGGGVCSATSNVTTVSGGPFNVTSQNTSGIAYAGGSMQTVTWNVGGTTASPISCDSVNIYLSLDGGNTWTTLAVNTANDGTEIITLPLVSGTNSSCRIKIDCPGNIFFDINDFNFTITDSLGLAENSAFNSISLQMVPNPFNSQIEINIYGLNVSEKTILMVYDLPGKIIRSEQLVSSKDLKLKYDLSDLSDGIYIVQLINGSRRAITRIVKQ